ncbi:glutathione S-transferase family protein [Piscinibacter sp.]|uniref:glutathione S-transferase family protein n=1 Tax=Piscinibacter sp. TaxID=1903157 RepID=UPI003559F1CB
MQLYIGNKNYSSWSMRPWVLMRQAGIAFDEVPLRLSFADDSAFKRSLANVSPAGRVPVLVDEGLSVWDTLAIAEYLAEKFPAKALWPGDRLQRARARSLCAEMHSGFAALRSHFPMNIEASLAAVGARVLADQADARRDLDRIVQMWTQQLAASGGPLLFGAFSIADAYFAPVCSRIKTYALPVPPAVQRYVDTVFALPATQAWTAAALAEHDFLDFDEPYRSAPLR